MGRRRGAWRRPGVVESRLGETGNIGYDKMKMLAIQSSRKCRQEKQQATGSDMYQFELPGRELSRVANC